MGAGGAIFMGENQPLKMPPRKIAPGKFAPIPQRKKKKKKEN